MTFFTSSPLWIAAVVFLGLGTLIAMLGPLVVRSLVPLQALRTNNEVAGFKFATVGVLYAVLLAFAVLVVWEKLNDAENEVAREAATAATIFRLADGMEPKTRLAVREATSAYLVSAIGADWPAMARGGESPATSLALSDIYVAILRDEPASARGGAILQEGLRQLDLLTQARRSRIVLAAGVVPDIVWTALLIGAAVTVGFTFFFGADNVRAQAAMTGALGFLIFSGLLVIVAIDRPFAGSVHVEPQPLITVLEDFGGAASAD